MYLTWSFETEKQNCGMIKNKAYENDEKRI